MLESIIFQFSFNMENMYTVCYYTKVCCLWYVNIKGGGGARFFFRWFWLKKIITNSYFIFFLMFICQNVGNLKGFLLVSLHGLYLITLSSYSSTGRGTSSSNKKKNKKKIVVYSAAYQGYL